MRMVISKFLTEISWSNDKFFAMNSLGQTASARMPDRQYLPLATEHVNRPPARDSQNCFSWVILHGHRAYKFVRTSGNPQTGYNIARWQ